MHHTTGEKYKDIAEAMGVTDTDWYVTRRSIVKAAVDAVKQLI